MDGRSDAAHEGIVRQKVAYSRVLKEWPLSSASVKLIDVRYVGDNCLAEQAPDADPYALAYFAS